MGNTKGSSTTVSEEKPSFDKSAVNPRTTLAVFTGGIDSTYLLHQLKKQFTDVGADLKDLIPVWFNGSNSEQLSAIKSISQKLGLTPLLLPNNTSGNPADYLPILADFCLDNGIPHLMTALTNDELLSPVAGLDVGLYEQIETEKKDARRRALINDEDATPEDLEKIVAFHIEYPIVGLNKSVIIKRLMENFKFNVSQCYRNKGEDQSIEVYDTIKGTTKKTSNHAVLDKIRKTAFAGTKFNDPLEPPKKAK